MKPGINRLATQIRRSLAGFAPGTGYSPKRYGQLMVLVMIDIVLINLAFFAALWFKYDGVVPGHFITSYQQLALPFTAAFIIAFFLFRLYNRLWQYASTGEMIDIVVAVSAAMLFNIALSYVVMQADAFPLPRSVFALAWLLIVLMVGGFRFSWRLLRGKSLILVKEGSRKLILIVGAGDAGATVARELKNHNGYKNIPIGFIDDDPAKQRMRLYNLPVLGKREDIPRVVDKYKVDEIVIAIPSASGREIREIVDICQSTNVPLKILPGIYDLIDGRVSVNQIREVQIEDLLGREPVKVDLASIAGYLSNRVVLVTGAGGSIGSELCRQIANFEPQELILLGRGENSIYEIYQDLSVMGKSFKIVPVIADIKDSVEINKIFKKYKPRVVFHAAAHKHVPLMEDSPAEAYKNNVIGTLHTARAAKRHGTGIFIFVSSDKAVNPVSIMGATKRIAEMVIQRIGANSGTCFASVRFGNVLDSRGSVVPLFKKQIARGGPVTVTDARMTRYFMTITEAVELVIQAGALARGGELFVLDMGEPVNILQLARRMVRLAGFEPDKDIEIQITGIRPGEKLFEEVLTAEEGLKTTPHERIYAALPGHDHAALEQLLLKTASTGWTAEKEEVVSLIRSILPHFQGWNSGEENKMYPQPGRKSLAK